MPPDTVLLSLLLAVVGFVAGAVASASNFGIGSLLTPVLAVRVVSADSAQAGTR